MNGPDSLSVAPPEPVGLLDEPYFDPRIESMVVRVTENFVVSVSPQLFNDRILLTSRLHGYPRTWLAGWCYDKGPAAMLAARVFDPETQHEPVGYKKVAADNR